MRGFNCFRFVVAGSMCLFSSPTQAQTDSEHPRISSDPLTVEQIAIYRAVISDYVRGSSGRLNIANITEAPHAEHPFFDDECAKSINVEPNSAGVVHRLDALVVGRPQLVLVEREGQQIEIERNDPQNLLKKAIDDHEKVTNEELDQSVKQAFESGLFTLSEIVFNRTHRRAVVAYSFVCGTLCGNGNTLVLKKVGKKWKISKRCGGWVS